MGTAAIAAVAAASATRNPSSTRSNSRADATAPDRAQTLDSLGLAGNRAVDGLFKAGVILPGRAAHSVYLSEVAYAAYRRKGQGRARALFGVGVALLIMAGALAFLVAKR
jgi:hypothetical protein